jgi:hypothetical protein
MDIIGNCQPDGAHALLKSKELCYLFNVVYCSKVDKIKKIFFVSSISSIHGYSVGLDFILLLVGIPDLASLLISWPDPRSGLYLLKRDWKFYFLNFLFLLMKETHISLLKKNQFTTS